MPKFVRAFFWSNVHQYAKFHQNRCTCGDILSEEWPIWDGIDPHYVNYTPQWHFYSQRQIFYRAKTVMMALTAMTHTHTYYISQTLPVSIADWVIKHYSANCTWPCLYVFDRKLGGQSFFMVFIADPWLLEKVMGENTSKYCFCQQIFFQTAPLNQAWG